MHILPFLDFFVWLLHWIYWNSICLFVPANIEASKKLRNKTILFPDTTFPLPWLNPLKSNITWFSHWATLSEIKSQVCFGHSVNICDTCMFPSQLPGSQNWANLKSTIVSCDLGTKIESEKARWARVFGNQDLFGHFYPFSKMNPMIYTTLSSSRLTIGFSLEDNLPDWQGIKLSFI